MNKNSILTIAVIVLVLMNAGIISFFLITKPPRPDGEGPKKIITERLRFDNDQIGRYDELIRRHQQTIRSSERVMMETKQELYASLSSADPALQDSLIRRLASAQERIERAHIEHFTALKELCRPDQQMDFELLSHELTELFSPKNRSLHEPR